MCPMTKTRSGKSCYHIMQPVFYYHSTISSISFPQWGAAELAQKADGNLLSSDGGFCGIDSRNGGQTKRRNWFTSSGAAVRGLVEFVKVPLPDEINAQSPSQEEASEILLEKNRGVYR